MSYRVGIPADEHEVVLKGAILDWTKQEHDVHFISREGYRIHSHKVLLSFYSSYLRHMFNESSEAFSSTPVTISLASSSSASISSLLNILLVGNSFFYWYCK